MNLTTLFIDLDDTLYPSSSGVWDAIGVRMNDYIHERLGIPREDVSHVRETLFKTYGTTLHGLQQTYGIDPVDFLNYVHAVPLADMLTPDPEIRRALLSLPQRKIILTNSDIHHAQRVLTLLNLSDCFEQIIDIHAIQPHCKPMEEAFLRALSLAGSPKPEECLLADDGVNNIAAARRLGFFTVYVGDDNHEVEADIHLVSLVELPEALKVQLAKVSYE
jgi:putative hydrolase of the HAD superfamily